ncbi:hypothetical protein [Streptomyces sp. DH12]|uniref:hypothetical protein n=1 Tax=Streptomyces sp. DH12 TaxID=2857010 RepID=UPI001E331AA6|nr:hypothetical protein [Streptomyces sp. DH12]
MSTTATCIETPDGQSVTVLSATPAVTAWAARYMGTWWNAHPTDPSAVTGPMVVADIDQAETDALTGRVLAGDAEEVTYANSRMVHRTTSAGSTIAAQPGDFLAYEWLPASRRLRIVGKDATAVATGAARLAREIVRGRLLADGWHILHASAVTRPTDGATLLALGNKGAGKTTSGFLLARCGFHLLANDRVFVRAEGDRVRVLPWPSAAAIGFGLLDALGWFETVRERLLSGEAMHPTQSRRVTDALLAGNRTPLWKSPGRELKPQFFPDQLRDWLSLTLATEGTAAAVLFPTIAPDADPALATTSRGIEPGDFFTGATEDRYPDVFGLLPPPRDTRDLADRLAQLPHQGLTLSHDTSASTVALEKAASQVL